ncbi:Sec14p-like phosphatidylinositol transfer family protein [Striga asiatica]|uniref:Sec14p-like phosphatidylinositol transfer family protein n=1 Tax=Striga asiatica TaxID=4170 RepID=A0A5A7PZ91_STRAF|nr:Sec14p-like phosphatidylinositol transfer family protein [Striga asiatica]
MHCLNIETGTGGRDLTARSFPSNRKSIRYSIRKWELQQDYPPLNVGAKKVVWSLTSMLMVIPKVQRMNEAMIRIEMMGGREKEKEQRIYKSNRRRMADPMELAAFDTRKITQAPPGRTPTERR